MHFCGEHLGHLSSTKNRRFNALQREGNVSLLMLAAIYVRDIPAFNIPKSRMRFDGRTPAKCVNDLSTVYPGLSFYLQGFIRTCQPGGFAGFLPSSKNGSTELG